jgi:hypothetical protein
MKGTALTDEAFLIVVGKRACAFSPDGNEIPPLLIRAYLWKGIKTSVAFVIGCYFLFFGRNVGRQSILCILDKKKCISLDGIIRTGKCTHLPNFGLMLSNE